MIMSRRRGFTMVELMIGLILTLAVGGVAYEMLLRSNRVTRAQSEHIGVQENVRSGALIVTNELREVGYDVISADASAALGGYAPATRTDLVQINPSFVRYHATRGLGFVCQVTTAAPATVVVRRDTWQELRTPQPVRDTLMLYVENAPNTAKDDAWVHLGIVAAPSNQNCGAVPGLAFQVAAPAGLVLATALNAVVIGGPARVTEVMRMEHYVDAADGKPYLGMRSESGGELQPQPLVGPLAANGGATPGLLFEYLDGNDAATAVLGNVRVIRVTLRGVTDEAVYGSRTNLPTLDTLGITTRVALRNTLR